MNGLKLPQEKVYDLEEEPRLAQKLPAPRTGLCLPQELKNRASCMPIRRFRQAVLKFWCQQN